MPHEIISDKASESLYKRTVEALLQHLLVQPQSAPLVLGLCSGRSVVGILSGLAALCSSEGSKYKEVVSRIQFFMVDERLVPLTDPQSNYGMLKSALFDSLLADKWISTEQLHPFNPDSSSPDYGTAKYVEELEKFGGKFSAIVLGVGEDGHVAGLFPHNQTLQIAHRGFVSFFDSPKPPSGRMTATASLLKKAELALVLFTGEAKRAAYQLFQDDRTSVSECPSVLTKEIKRTIVVTDLL